MKPLPPPPGTVPAPRILLPLAALVLLLPPPAAHAQAQRPVLRTECNSAGLALAEIGTTRLQSHHDGHGTTVELWCIRGVFAANFDLRVLRNGRSATIAGCYFNQARNTGPVLHIAPTGAYTGVEWINESLSAEGTSYRFAYNLASDTVTITATAACRAPVTTVVAPQQDFQTLERLLPSLPGPPCTPSAPEPPPPDGG